MSSKFVDVIKVVIPLLIVTIKNSDDQSEGWCPEGTMKSLCAVGGRLGWQKSFSFLSSFLSFFLSFFFLARLTWELQLIKFVAGTANAK